MIGNDIVDLKLADKQSNWRRKGFLQKVFSVNERSMILKSSKPDVIVWKLWSMKESVYKARLRVKKHIQINPKDFVCQILEDDKGLVVCDGKIYHTTSEVNDDYINTQSFEGEFDSMLFSKVLDMNLNALNYKGLYDALISSVAINMNWDNENLMLVKDALGIPEIYKTGQKTPILCSLSHHGRYGSYLMSC